MAKENCKTCGKKLGIFTGRHGYSGNQICDDCLFEEKKEQKVLELEQRTQAISQAISEVCLTTGDINQWC